jgi:hypothetical protein
MALSWAPSALAEDAPQSAPAAPGGSSLARSAGPWVVAAGGAALLAGIGTGFAAREREQDAWSSCRGGSGGKPECPERVRADFDAAQGLATATNVLLIGGGLLTVTGLGLVIAGAGAREAANQAQVELSPSFGPHGSGFSLTGAF